MHRMTKNRGSVDTNTFHYQFVAECVYLQVFDYQMSKGEELKSKFSQGQPITAQSDKGLIRENDIFISKKE